MEKEKKETDELKELTQSLPFMLLLCLFSIDRCFKL